MFPFVLLLRLGGILCPGRLQHAHRIALSIGKKDVVLAGNTIAAIGGDFNLASSNLPVTVIDASDFYLTPGFVDSLVHFIGGGGEGGGRGATTVRSPSTVPASGA